MPSFDSPTYGSLPQALPPGSPNMQMSDLGVAPVAPEGVELWGNPVLDSPPVDVEAMFPEETAPESPLGMEECPMCGGMGCEMCGGAAPAAASAMNSEQIRAAAKSALLQKAQQRMAASQGFQDSATNMAKRQF